MVRLMRRKAVSPTRVIVVSREVPGHSRGGEQEPAPGDGLSL
jgi:hypothetical protein